MLLAWEAGEGAGRKGFVRTRPWGRPSGLRRRGRGYGTWRGLLAEPPGHLRQYAWIRGNEAPG